MKKNINIIVFIFLGLAIFYSCKPKKDPEPQIPCEQLADFKIYETYYYQNMNSDTWLTSPPVENDTFGMAQGVSDHRVYFEAKYEGADKYEWWIGNETTPRVGKKISVLFLSSEIQTNITISIKLKVTRKDRKECNEEGIYATTKTITLLKPDKVSFIGKYVAYDENNQPKIIEVSVQPDNIFPGSVIYRIHNLVGIGVCNTIIPNTLEYSTAFSFVFSTYDTYTPIYNCFSRRGGGQLDPQNRNKLVLNYTLENTGASTTFPRQIKNIIAYRIP